MSIKIGTFVEYKAKQYIACTIVGNKVKLFSPTHGKVFVLLSNCTYIHKRPATIVEGRYMVTPLGLIISLTTNREMKWGDTSPERQVILRKAALVNEQAI